MATPTFSEPPPASPPKVAVLEAHRGGVDQSSRCTEAKMEHAFPFPAALLLEVRRLKGNDRCMDCGSSDASWSSVSMGTLICLQCAGRHRSLGVHVSFVRNLTMDNWTAAQAKQMHLGGNSQLLSFLKTHELESLPLETKYLTPQAQFYRERLKEEAERQVKELGLQALEVSPKASPRARRKENLSALSELPEKATRSLTAPTPVSNKEDVRDVWCSFGEGRMGLRLTRAKNMRATISLVTPNGNADVQGLQVGDFIVGMNGKRVGDYDEVMELVQRLKRPISITFRRLQRQDGKASGKDEGNTVGFQDRRSHSVPAQSEEDGSEGDSESDDDAEPYEKGFQAQEDEDDTGDSADDSDGRIDEELEEDDAAGVASAGLAKVRPEVKTLAKSSEAEDVAGCEREGSEQQLPSGRVSKEERISRSEDEASSISTSLAADASKMQVDAPPNGTRSPPDCDVETPQSEETEGGRGAAPFKDEQGVVDDMQNGAIQGGSGIGKLREKKKKKGKKAKKGKKRFDPGAGYALEESSPASSSVGASPAFAEPGLFDAGLSRLSLSSASSFLSDSPRKGDLSRHEAISQAEEGDNTLSEFVPGSPDLQDEFFNEDEMRLTDASDRAAKREERRRRKRDAREKNRMIAHIRQKGVVFGAGPMGFTVSRETPAPGQPQTSLPPGVPVTNVKLMGPACQAGVCEGDRVVAVNEQPVMHYDHLMRLISGCPRPVHISFRCRERREEELDRAKIVKAVSHGSVRGSSSSVASIVGGYGSAGKGKGEQEAEAGGHAERSLTTTARLLGQIQDSQEFDVILKDGPLGMRLEERGGYLPVSVVTAVTQGQQAEAAGIRVGCTVVGINGEKYICHAHTVASLRHGKRPIGVRFRHTDR